VLVNFHEHVLLKAPVLEEIPSVNSIAGQAAHA
jgi:hypothetical protein